MPPSISHSIVAIIANRSIPIATWKCVKLTTANVRALASKCKRRTRTQQQNGSITTYRTCRPPVVTLPSSRVREIAFRYTKQQTNLASNRVLLAAQPTQNCTFFRSAPITKRRIFSDQPVITVFSQSLKPRQQMIHQTQNRDQHFVFFLFYFELFTCLVKPGPSRARSRSEHKANSADTVSMSGLNWKTERKKVAAMTVSLRIIFIYWNSFH